MRSGGRRKVPVMASSKNGMSRKRDVGFVGVPQPVTPCADVAVLLATGFCYPAVNGRGDTRDGEYKKREAEEINHESSRKPEERAAMQLPEDAKERDFPVLLRFCKERNALKKIVGGNRSIKGGARNSHERISLRGHRHDGILRAGQ